MNNAKWILSVAILTASLIYSNEAAASFCEPCCEVQTNDCGFYFGGQVGYVNTNWENINENSFNKTEIIVKKDDGVGVRPFIGYALNQYIAFEFGWTYLNQAKISRWSEFGFFNKPLCKITNQAYDLSLRLSVPIACCDAGLVTRVGLSYLKANNSVKWRENGEAVFEADPIHHNPAIYNITYAFGVYYDLTCRWRAEVTWTHFGGDPSTGDNYLPDPDFYSFGITYKL